jgi:hypothetical protein
MYVTTVSPTGEPIQANSRVELDFFALHELVDVEIVVGHPPPEDVVDRR